MSSQFGGFGGGGHGGGYGGGPHGGHGHGYTINYHYYINISTFCALWGGTCIPLTDCNVTVNIFKGWCGYTYTFGSSSPAVCCIPRETVCYKYRGFCTNSTMFCSQAGRLLGHGQTTRIASYKAPVYHHGHGEHFGSDHHKHWHEHGMEEGYIFDKYIYTRKHAVLSWLQCNSTHRCCRPFKKKRYFSGKRYYKKPYFSHSGYGSEHKRHHYHHGGYHHYGGYSSGGYHSSGGGHHHGGYNDHSSHSYYHKGPKRYHGRGYGGGGYGGGKGDVISYAGYGGGIGYGYDHPHGGGYDTSKYHDPAKPSAKSKKEYDDDDDLYYDDEQKFDDPSVPLNDDVKNVQTTSLPTIENDRIQKADIKDDSINKKHDENEINKETDTKKKVEKDKSDDQYISENASQNFDPRFEEDTEINKSQKPKE